jgi:hypothetical protein
MVSQCSGNENKQRTFVYNLNEKLENEYFFINVNDKRVCLICSASVALSKRCNIELHFMIVHKDSIQQQRNK